MGGLASPRLWMSLLAVAFVAFAFTAATLPATDPDAFWVAAAGRWMLRAGQVPTSNLFSFVDGPRPWVMHEWLFGPPYAQGLAAFGPGFFAAVAVGSSALATAALVLGTAEEGRFQWPGAAVALFALSCFGPRLLTARPANVALSLAIGMAALGFSSSFGRLQLAAAVALEWAWANVHGSFPLGVLLLGAGAAVERDGRRDRALAAGLAAGITLLNPYGPRLHALVWDYLWGAAPVQQLIREHVLEFRPLWAAEAFLASRSGSVGLAGMGVLALGALLTRGFRVRGLLSLLLLAEAVLRVRHLELAGLVSAVLVAPWAAHLAWRGHPRPARPARPARHAALVAVAPGLAVAAVAMAVARPAEPISPVLGGGAAARLAAALPEGARAWAPFASTGLVLWYAPPGAGLLFDARNDCYTPEVARDAFTIEVEPVGPERIREVLDRYGVTHVLGPPGHQVVAAVRDAPPWREVAAGGAWRVLARTAGPEAGTVPGP